MNSAFTERPHFFEGQYLGADDLKVLVDYHRIQDARHNLGLHTWGIATGLELTEVEVPNGSIEVFIQPGYAIDGYGRSIVVLNPHKISTQILANAPAGLIPIWLRYSQHQYQGIRQGFEVCNCDDEFERVGESFAVEAGLRNSVGDRQSGILLAGNTELDARDALRRFDDDAPIICDGSVPHQLFPEDTDKARWLIPVGYVSWLPGTPGVFQELNDDQRRLSRIFRRHVGVVTETIQAANGLIRLRTRTTESDINQSNDTICERTQIQVEDFETDAGAIDFEDLVWIEGNLRVEGNARLFGTKLELRDGEGRELNTPMYLRRGPGSATAPESGNLEVVVGLDDSARDNNRFVIGTADNEGNHVPKVVFTDGGKVGIGAPSPQDYFEDADDLVVKGNESHGITISSGTEATGNIRFARGAADDASQRGRISFNHLSDVLSIGTGSGNDDPLRVAPSGKVGIGIDDPVSPLHVGIGSDVSLADNSGYLVIGSIGHRNIAMDGNEIQARDTGSRATLHLQAEGGGLVVNQHQGEGRRLQVTHDGRLGIGTTSPAGKLDVHGRILRNGVEFSKTGHAHNGGIVNVPWGTVADWNIFVSPRSMGLEEGGSEADNALLKLECFATEQTTSWQVTARYKYNFANSPDGEWKDGTANYLLVPR